MAIVTHGLRKEVQSDLNVVEGRFGPFNQQQQASQFAAAAAERYD